MSVKAKAGSLIEKTLDVATRGRTVLGGRGNWEVSLELPSVSKGLRTAIQNYKKRVELVIQNPKTPAGVKALCEQSLSQLEEVSRLIKQRQMPMRKTVPATAEIRALLIKKGLLKEDPTTGTLGASKEFRDLLIAAGEQIKKGEKPEGVGHVKFNFATGEMEEP